MKKLLFLFLLCCVFSAEGQRAVYDRFASRSNLDVAYAKDYQLDSINQVDVIFIKAKDSSAWVELLEDFFFDDISRGLCMHGIFMYKADRDDPTIKKPGSYENACTVFMALDYQEMLLCFVQNEDQFVKLWRVIHKKYFSIAEPNQPGEVVPSLDF